MGFFKNLVQKLRERGREREAEREREREILNCCLKMFEEKLLPNRRLL
jgi:hypothetical protein